MTTIGDAAEVLVVRRQLAFPREQVFAAWLDGASLAQWMRPSGTPRATVEVDPRVGGRFRIVMHMKSSPQGSVCSPPGSSHDHEHRGEYLAIEPPSLLSFTWISKGTGFLPTVVTLEFLERGSGTELVLTHQRLPQASLESHRQGWTTIVRELEEVLASGRAADARTDRERRLR
jgi:uncharacterized protein YndB with AHSA1/START domain